MHISFKFELADGSHVSGPVQGNGGLIGAASMHCMHPSRRDSHTVRRLLQAALLRLQGEQLRAKCGRPLAVYEPEPGHVACKPDYCAASDGEIVQINLTTAKIIGAQLVGVES